MSTSQPPAGALRLARVAGVPVYLDRSWLVLAAILLWVGWSSAEGLGAGTQVAYAVWLVVSILLAVLAHEGGHAIAARSLGFHVHRVVATLFGGHTAYDGTGATAGRTAAVAVAGPAANLALAAVGGVGTALTSGPAWFFAWSFALLNLLLAGFNLLPGLPLDGGAILQSLVWGVTGRRDRGLVVAGWAGRAVAVGVFLWFGVRPLLSGELDTFDLVISLLMGWILWQGASAGLARVPLERLLRVLRPEQVLEPAVVVPPTTPLGEALDRPEQVLVRDDRDLPTLVLPPPRPDAPDLRTMPPEIPLSAAVVRLPDACLVEIAPGGDVEPVLRAMSGTGWGLVVVASGGEVRGVVTAERLDAAAKQVLGQSETATS